MVTKKKTANEHEKKNLETFFYWIRFLFSLTLLLNPCVQSSFVPNVSCPKLFVLQCTSNSRNWNECKKKNNKNPWKKMISNEKRKANNKIILIMFIRHGCHGCHFDILFHLLFSLFFCAHFVVYVLPSSKIGFGHNAMSGLTKSTWKHIKQWARKKMANEKTNSFLFCSQKYCKQMWNEILETRKKSISFESKFIKWNNE